MHALVMCSAIIELKVWEEACYKGFMTSFLSSLSELNPVCGVSFP